MYTKDFSIWLRAGALAIALLAIIAAGIVAYESAKAPFVREAAELDQLP